MHVSITCFPFTLYCLAWSVRRQVLNEMWSASVVPIWKPIGWFNSSASGGQVQQTLRLLPVGERLWKLHTEFEPWQASAGILYVCIRFSLTTLEMASSCLNVFPWTLLMHWNNCIILLAASQQLLCLHYVIAGQMAHNGTVILLHEHFSWSIPILSQIQVIPLYVYRSLDTSSFYCSSTSMMTRHERCSSLFNTFSGVVSKANWYIYLLCLSTLWTVGRQCADRPPFMIITSCAGCWAAELCVGHVFGAGANLHCARRGLDILVW